MMYGVNVVETKVCSHHCTSYTEWFEILMWKRETDREREREGGRGGHVDT